jgi:hypothetical protein
VDIFNSMSNVMADAEDLLVALRNSPNSDVQALTEEVEKSVDEMRVVFRRQLKARAGNGERLCAPVTFSPWAMVGLAAIATALLTRTFRRHGNAA